MARQRHPQGLVLDGSEHDGTLVRFAGGTATDKSDTSFDARIRWANAMALHFEPIAIAKSRPDRMMRNRSAPQNTVSDMVSRAT